MNCRRCSRACSKRARRRLATMASDITKFATAVHQLAETLPGDTLLARARLLHALAGAYVEAAERKAQSPIADTAALLKTAADRELQRRRAGSSNNGGALA